MIAGQATNFISVTRKYQGVRFGWRNINLEPVVPDGENWTVKNK
jgi:hypothetical protein